TAFAPLEVLGQPEVAPRDDVLLDLGGPTAHRLVHGGAVGALEAAAQRRLVLAFHDRAGCARDVERVLADPLRERRREELVLRRLDRRRLSPLPWRARTTGGGGP